MRIIDKNTDFYDYLQNIYYDTSVTFDRKDSFVLTKDLLKYKLSIWIHHLYFNSKDYKVYLLLQVCNTFWLFLADLDIKESPWEGLELTDYTLSLVSTWKNYNKKRELIKLDIIEFPFYLKRRRKESELLVDAINQNNYEITYSLNKHTILKHDGKDEEKHIPLLKACGIGPLVDPLEIYNSIEEYFNLEKQSSERTESIGLTNNEKIENHGFDTKTSFRGK